VALLVSREIGGDGNPAGMIVAPLPAGHEQTFMDLKLIIAMLAIAAAPVCARAQQSSTAKLKAEAHNVVQIISSDKAKTQAYCNLSKLYDQIEAAEQKNDSDTIQALTKQADAMVANLGPEYPKMIEGLEQVDLTSSEGKEFLSILSGLDKLCTK
jgi:hypothetical protein